MDHRLPQRKEEGVGIGSILWKRRLSVGVVNPILVMDRFVILESAGHLYAFNVIDGTMIDGDLYAQYMRGVDASYFAFSGLIGPDLKGMPAHPGITPSINTNNIWDLATFKKIFSLPAGTAGIPLVTGSRAFFGFIDRDDRSSLIAYDLKRRRMLWETNLSDQRIILKFPPVTDGERVYLRTMSHLSAFVIKSGRAAWNTKLTGKEKEEGYRNIIYFSAPVVWNKTVYLFRDEYLIPYRAKTGETNYNSWRRHLGSIGLNAVESTSPPILTKNRLYTAGGLYFLNGSLRELSGDPGGYSRIAAIDLAEKRTLWEADTEKINVQKMAVGGKFLVAADHQGQVLCLSSKTGRTLWTVEIEGGVRVKPVIYFGRVFIGTDQGWLYCISL